LRYSRRQSQQEHRFVLDITRDQLDSCVCRRYLAYENAFVETAITIFGYLPPPPGPSGGMFRLITI
jgi:hypothetical protein